MVPVMSQLRTVKTARYESRNLAKKFESRYYSNLGILVEAGFVFSFNLTII